MINLKTTIKAKNSKLIIFFLILSFVWISIYPVLSSLTFDFYFNYGNVLDFASQMFSSALFYVLSSAILSWVGVELIFMFYRFILSFKIYSFILPAQKLKDEMRMFFIYRNIIFGLFLNICFIFPYLHSFSVLVDLLVTMISFICFANHISKVYSEPLIGHFVFRCFINPIILYEIIVVTINFLEVV